MNIIFPDIYMKENNITDPSDLDGMESCPYMTMKFPNDKETVVIFLKQKNHL